MRCPRCQTKLSCGIESGLHTIVCIISM